MGDVCWDRFQLALQGEWEKGQVVDVGEKELEHGYIGDHGEDSRISSRWPVTCDA